MESTYKIRVSNETIVSTKKRMLEETNELKSNLTKFLDNIDDTENIYNTDSATIYRRIAYIYIKSKLAYLNEFDNLISKLDTAANTYDEVNNYIAKSVKVGDNE